MEFVPLLVLALLVRETIKWVRVLVPDDLEVKILIPLAMGIGVLFALLFSLGDDIAGAVTIWGDNTLASASLPLVIIYGLAIGATAGTVQDVVRPRNVEVAVAAPKVQVDVEAPAPAPAKRAPAAKKAASS